mmetsp:Transcript_99118/g.276000  ORF Transcript_99118/g.276000 Transcript_99118/m.276000 type:complete len:323 (-) Transcript_99118:357-1325(-)
MPLLAIVPDNQMAYHHGNTSNALGHEGSDLPKKHPTIGSVHNLHVVHHEAMPLGDVVAGRCIRGSHFPHVFQVMVVATHDVIGRGHEQDPLANAEEGEPKEDDNAADLAVQPFPALYIEETLLRHRRHPEEMQALDFACQVTHKHHACTDEVDDHREGLHVHEPACGHRLHADEDEQPNGRHELADRNPVHARAIHLLVARVDVSEHVGVPAQEDAESGHKAESKEDLASGRHSIRDALTHRCREMAISGLEGDAELVVVVQEKAHPRDDESQEEASESGDAPDEQESRAPVSVADAELPLRQGSVARRAGAERLSAQDLGV